MDYTICQGDVGDINIGVGDCSYLNAFLTIYVDDESTPSPFSNMDDAKLFAELIVKLLKVITDDVK